MTIHIGLLIDKSGSMWSCAEATKQGCNEQIEALQKHEADLRITLATFNDSAVFYWFDAPNKELKPFYEYKPDGGTALYNAILEVVSRWEKLPQEDVFVLVSMTDGQETNNHSIAPVIKEKIAKMQERNYTFAFLVANQPITDIQHKLGIPAQNLKTYSANPAGTLRAMQENAAYLRSFIREVEGGKLKTESFFQPEIDILAEDCNADILHLVA